MNCSEAKKIPIVGYLASCGIIPDKVRGNEAWYKSPLRDDHSPSFAVNRDKNTWYDMGTGTGGNLIDLVMELHRTSITGALIILQSPATAASQLFFSCQQDIKTTDRNPVEIKHIQPLQNIALIQYLQGRNIPFDYASRYVQEIYYRVNGRQFFSIGFRNDKGGYDLRNRSGKYTILPKGITTINGDNSSVCLFEGFINFLSALVYYKKPRPEATFIILNGVGFTSEALPLLKTFAKISLFLDNDPAGENAALQVKEQYPEATDYAKIIYPDFNDFNDFLMNTKRQ